MAGTAIWTQPGGSIANSVSHWEREGQARTRRRGGFQGGAQTPAWAAVENPETGHVLLAVTSGNRAQCHLQDMAENGAHLNPNNRMDLAPGETREFVHWLVLTRDLTTLKAYAGLKELRRPAVKRGV